MRTFVESAYYERDQVTGEYRHTNVYYVVISDDRMREDHYILRCSCDVEFRQLNGQLIETILAELPPAGVDGPPPGELGGPPVHLPPDEVFPVFRPEYVEFDRQQMCPRYYVKRPKLLRSADPVRRQELRSFAESEVLFFETVLRHNEHPNIVKYHGCWVVDGWVVGLVLERLPTSLYLRCLDTKTPLNVESVIGQVRAALEHLHTNLYVCDNGGNKVQVPYCHNDVNVHNIMLAEDGDRDVAVLIDFDACVRAGRPLGKTMVLDPVGRTSNVDIDWRGLEEVESALREVFPENATVQTK